MQQSEPPSNNAKEARPPHKQFCKTKKKQSKSKNQARQPIHLSREAVPAL
jgi:hypothetical protein